MFLFKRFQCFKASRSSVWQCSSALSIQTRVNHCRRHGVGLLSVRCKSVQKALDFKVMNLPDAGSYSELQWHFAISESEPHNLQAVNYERFFFIIIIIMIKNIDLNARNSMKLFKGTSCLSLAKIKKKISKRKRIF